MREETYLIEGMSCAACSAAVERVTRKLEGVERSDVNLTTNRMIIYYDEAKVTRELIMSKVKKAGFGISLYEEVETEETSEHDTNYVNQEKEEENNKCSCIYSISFVYIYGTYAYKWLADASYYRYG